MLFDRVLDPSTVWVVIPVTGIVMGCAVAIVKSVIRHRERMAKIGMGIDPDTGSSIGQTSLYGSSRRPDPPSQI
jgi:hypothetical protein